MKEKIKRYILLLIGLFVVAFGVSLITKASLGTSPIASIPYCISLVVEGISFGRWLIAYCFLLIFMQILMLGRKCNWFELLVQSIISLTFGYCTDFFMKLLSGFTPERYVVKILTLLAGCAVLALGAAIELTANVAMLPIDALEHLISQKIHKDYSKIRLVADVGMVAVSAVMCLVFLGELSAVREGTIIAALLTGNLVKVFVKVMKPVGKMLER